MYLKVFSLKLS